VFAIISGFFIIGLTLYSAALDRIKDYGTLKAIGATNSYVRNLILLQSFFFAIIGFVIAFALLLGFKKGVENAGLAINYSTLEILGLFIITLFISMGGSLLPSKKSMESSQPRYLEDNCEFSIVNGELGLYEGFLIIADF
jgi:putative ABC transport system permease protein